jgi:hypothetical protein
VVYLGRWQGTTSVALKKPKGEGALEEMIKEAKMLKYVRQVDIKSLRLFS